MFVHHIYNWKSWRMLHYQLWWYLDILIALGNLTFGGGWSFTLFPSIGFTFGSKTKWISIPHVKSTNSTMLYFASTIPSLANNTYFVNRFFYTSKIQRGTKTCQLICYFHFFILTFIIYGKINTLVCQLFFDIM